MDPREWRVHYNEIVKEFGYSKEADRSAAQLLSSLLGENEKIAPQDDTWSSLGEMVEGKDVIVFGAADSVDGHIRRLMKEGRMEGPILMAADGATTALLENDAVPDIIVTDLDGHMPDIGHCINEKGTTGIVHAHGDNMRALRRHVPLLRGKVVGTTQGEPFGAIRNYGGFTDGDRAAFTADGLGAKTPMVLAGFDFGRVGRFSFGCDEEVKLRKLERARRLLGELDCEFL